MLLIFEWVSFSQPLWVWIAVSVPSVGQSLYEVSRSLSELRWEVRVISLLWQVE